MVVEPWLQILAGLVAGIGLILALFLFWCCLGIAGRDSREEEKRD